MGPIESYIPKEKASRRTHPKKVLNTMSKQLRKRKNSRPRLVAIAAAMACTMVTRLDAMNVAVVNEGGKGAAPAQLPVRRFHIVAGPLDTALEAYRQQSGVAVKSTMPAGQLGTLYSAGLQGLYTSQSALRELLRGRG
jgi:catecholate siderophore receptor